MPSAVNEMAIDCTQFFGMNYAPFYGTKSVSPGYFHDCPSTEVFQSFYCIKRVGNYLIGKKLGEGSFAKVREGLHVTTGEKVAVKVIDKEKVKQDTYMTKNLRREGQIHQMIRHPNIVQLLDILETENSYYLVTELCPGGNLMNRIYENNCLEEAEVQKYIRQLVMAVEHLHRAGVVHRCPHCIWVICTQVNPNTDLKIENLLLDEDDNIKLIDFGLSNCGEILGYTDPFSTQCGSPAYAAPELLSRKKYGRKVDVWSIGVNMYAMLTGMLPFTVEPYSIKFLHNKMLNKEINPLPPHLSSEAVKLLMDLLEPDPVKRPTIQQVMANPWLHQDEAPYKPTYLNRIHIKAINHRVVLHMTENMGYKYSDVLSTVLNNRACHTLAIYFLLDSRIQRQARQYQEQLEKHNKCEAAQTLWVINDRVCSSPKTAPASPARSKSPAKDKKVNTGHTYGRGSDVGPGGRVASPLLEHPERSQFLPRTPQQIRRLETKVVGGRGQVDLEVPTGSGSTAHSWDSLAQELNSMHPVPWLRIANRHHSPAHIPSLRTPSPPARTWTPEPESPARLTEAYMDPMRLNVELPRLDGGYTDPARLNSGYTDLPRMNGGYTDPMRLTTELPRLNGDYTDPARLNGYYTDPMRLNGDYTDPTRLNGGYTDPMRLNTELPRLNGGYTDPMRLNTELPRLNGDYTDPARLNGGYTDPMRLNMELPRMTEAYTDPARLNGGYTDPMRLNMELPRMTEAYTNPTRLNADLPRLNEGSTDLTGSTAGQESSRPWGRFPVMGLSRFLRKHSPPLFFRTKPEPANTPGLFPYHLHPLFCASGAVKTLC